MKAQSGVQVRLYMFLLLPQAEVSGQFHALDRKGFATYWTEGWVDPIGGVRSFEEESLYLTLQEIESQLWIVPSAAC